MKNSKKAFIDKIMLGFFLFAFGMIFLGAVSDQLTVRNKVLALKKVAQTASLSAAKYYINEMPNTIEAQDIANKVVSSTPLGKEVVDDIEYDWQPNDIDPDSLIVTIPSYKQDFFWFRLIGWDSKEIKNISSKVNIVRSTQKDEADDFLPIAVNGCSEEYNVNTTYNKLYETVDAYDENDSIAFYSLAFNFKNPMENFQNMMQNMAQNHQNRLDIKNRFEEGFELPFKFAHKDSNTTSSAIKDMANSFRTLESKNVTIAVLDCGSTEDNLIIKELLPIEILPNTQCTKACCEIKISPADIFSKFTNSEEYPEFSFGSCGNSILSMPINMMCSMLSLFQHMKDTYAPEQIPDLFNVDNSSVDCNDANMFRFSFRVRSKDKVLLEY